MIKGNVEVIEKFSGKLDSIEFDVAWNSIKKFIREAKNTSTNTASIQCAVCGSEKVDVIHSCEECRAEIDVSNWLDRTQNTSS